MHCCMCAFFLKSALIVVYVEVVLIFKAFVSIDSILATELGSFLVQDFSTLIDKVHE